MLKKNQKKSLLMLSIASACSFTMANSYVTIVSKQSNDYVNSSETAGEWKTVSSNCTVDKETSAVYHSYEFEQTQKCSEVQEQKTTVVTVDENGNEVTRIDTSTRMIELDETKVTAIGIHFESSCSDILSNGYSQGDNMYVLERTGKQPTVFCDMDEGGFTFSLVTPRGETDWMNITWNSGYAPSPNFNLNIYADIESKCQAIGLPTFADYTSGSNHYWNVAREFLKNETNYFKPSQGDGAGIALGLNRSSGSWKTFSGSSTSLIPIDTSDQADHCTTGQEVCGFWDARDSHSYYGYGAGPEDWSFLNTEAIMCGGKW